MCRRGCVQACAGTYATVLGAGSNHALRGAWKGQEGASSSFQVVSPQRGTQRGLVGDCGAIYAIGSYFCIRSKKPARADRFHSRQYICLCSPTVDPRQSWVVKRYLYLQVLCVIQITRRGTLSHTLGFSGARFLTELD